MIQRIDEAEFAIGKRAAAGVPSGGAPIVVMKFGGTSLDSPPHWHTLVALVRNRLADGLRPVVVLAAIGKTTRDLDRMIASTDPADVDAQLDAIRRVHLALADSLGLDARGILAPTLEGLESALACIQPGDCATPQQRAELLAHGELLASAIGEAFLRHSGIDTHAEDARKLLSASEPDDRSASRRYLFADCDYAPDQRLWQSLESRGSVLLTQGFIARNGSGETVLLGREGSDTTAAYLAAKFQARRVEIWTDVPGIFSADPRLVPSARLLCRLQYDEALELAANGTKVLHPKCLRPLWENDIPLFVRSSDAPNLSGTLVTAADRDAEPQVKGISVKQGVTLLALDTVSMWHEAGFLARVFDCFARYEISVDRISTAESSVTVSIDPDASAGRAIIPDAMLEELRQWCTVRVIEDCATISLIGRKIRTFLPTLSPALSIFEEERIHLVSQAANDLNFSFVIDQEQLVRLIERFHASVVRPRAPFHGPSWDEILRQDGTTETTVRPWWLAKREQLLEIAEQNENAYIYDVESIRTAATGILSLDSVDRVLFAMKANFNPTVLKVLADNGVDFDCVSPGEVQHLRQAVPEILTERILFTPNFAPRIEYAWALDEGLLVTLDNLYPLRAWPALFAGRDIFIRLDPGVGRGHHEHVRTAGIHSKFGIPLFEVDELVRLLADVGANVIGIHAHIGSGILEPANWRPVAAELTRIAARFPNATVIDLGGGFGVPEKSGDPVFDLALLDSILADVRREFPQYRLWLEPGRYLVAQAGVLLSHVTQLKGKADMRYVGIATGMNALIRPALYGAYHEIVNLSRVSEPACEVATVVGPICESGDKLGSDRLLPPSAEGDVFLIANAGAYSRVMSSSYNLRDIPPEIVIWPHKD